MFTETITWHDLTEEYPEHYKEVLVEMRGCEDSIGIGCTDGENWWDHDNMPVEVIRWAEKPKGCGDAMVAHLVRSKMKEAA